MDPVSSIHGEVARLTAPLDVVHADRLRCRPGCSSCCVDDLTVFPVEADLIRRHHAELLDSGEPHPEGACAFLDDCGLCRIYEHRPYVCRTQGYPLRWFDEREDEEGPYLVELRDICPLNDEPGADPLEDLPPDECWTLGPIESRLAMLQGPPTDGSPLPRVRLRNLFARGGEGG